MTIKQQGGIFGRNPTFNDVTAEGTTSLDGPVVINESGADVDFRVEGDTQQNALFVDGTNGHVGVGIANPPYKLVVSNGGAEGLEIGPGYLGGRTLFQNYNRSTSAYVAAWEYASEYVWNIGGTEKMRLNTSGNLAMASGNGIDFSATSGTGTSELFDDYEEGVFEPSFGGATSDPTVTYDNPNETSGIYRKIGSLVFFSISIRTDSATGGSGRLLIKGLPFTCATGLGESASCSVYVGYSALFGTNPTMGTVEANTTQIGLRYRATHNADASNSDVTHLSNSANSNYIYIAGSYVAA
jgi:hypothetical protein